MVWPSRVVACAKASCPQCGREMQAKHLAYGHCCKGSVAARSAEAPARATETFNRRCNLATDVAFDTSSAKLQADNLADAPPVGGAVAKYHGAPASPKAGPLLLAELDAALGRP